MDKADVTVFLCFAATMLAVVAAFVNLVFCDHAMASAEMPYVI